MAAQEHKYLIRWRSMIFGEVDFWDEVQASSPEEACKIASEGQCKEFLEVYTSEVEEL